MRALVFALALLVPAVSAQSTATYQVTFESAWSQATHPTDWPGSSAHYSQLVGATHASPGDVWSAGGVASAGIEQMAETGGTSMLRAETDALIASGEVYETWLGPAMSNSPGTVTMEISVTESHPLISLVTMIAPSPDWFVGVEGVDLLELEGWQVARTVSLQAWDAGTDSGTAYTSQNEDTQPREPISLSNAAPFAGGAALGTLRFELLSVVSEEAAPTVFSLGPVAPNPSRGSSALSITMDEAQDVSVRVIDLLGREMARRDVRLGAGSHRLDLPTAALASGSYLVRVVTADATATRRLAVVR